MDCRIYHEHLDEIDSTNRFVRDEAARLWSMENGCGMVAVTAAYQTAGRGQRGNTWDSAIGNNLLLTILVRPGKALEVTQQFLLSQTVAVAIHKALERYGIDARLKWPNDIYVGNRKLAGVLVELDYMGKYVEQVVIGIGLNVNQCDFPEMDRVPVSMKMLLDRVISVDDVLAEILDCFNLYYSELMCGGGLCIPDKYMSLLLGWGEVSEYKDLHGRFRAVVECVGPDGYLFLRRLDGSISRYAFKEVEMLL